MVERVLPPKEPVETHRYSTLGFLMVTGGRIAVVF